MKNFLLFCAIFPPIGLLFAQQKPDIPYDSPEIESIIENDQQDNASSSATLEELEFYHAHPVNVNTATFDQLTKVPFLPAAAAIRILYRRDSLGTLSSSDLCGIPELDDRTIELVSQFLVFGNSVGAGSVSESSYKISSRTRTVLQLHPPEPFEKGTYLGSDVREYQRIELTSSKFSGGLLYDRDPGETFEDGFVGGHAGFENEGLLRKLVIGDFTLNAGEGLTLSSFRSSSKGGDALSQIKAAGRTIVPHLSADEFHYFQGCAMTIDQYPFEVTGFFSYKPVDGSIDSTNTITSFYTDGLFRSPSELLKKNVGHQTAFGGIGTYHIGTTQRVGVTFVQSQFDKEVALNSLASYHGRRFASMGFNTNLVFDSFDLFGEAAYNSLASRSSVCGIIFRVSKQFSFSAHVRSYSERFISPFGFAFGEQEGSVNGEEGQYLGMEYRATNDVKVSSYYDQFLIPSSGSFAQTGAEYVVRLEGALTKSASAFVQFREKKKTTEHSVMNASGESLDVIDERGQRNLRASCTFRVGKGVNITERIELNDVSYSVAGGSERGTLAFTELNVSPPRSAFFGSARVVFFDTPSYDSRLYEYEDNVHGGYSLPALYGSGVRWYFVFGWQILQQAEISFKYNETLKPGAAALGSGDSEIPGPLDNGLTLQADLTF
ncbi:MAG TPA: helix-hairpin-helix domain-containing protein [Bacteroidota bacterium]|nr:helix-hairpin-helix domain-containing protein [Bacteroidota bacterium]